MAAIPEIEIMKMISNSVNSLMGTISSPALEQANKNLADYRTNPREDLKTLSAANSLDKVGDAGSKFGAVGALAAGLKEILGSGKTNKEIDSQVQDWSRFWGSRSVQNTSASGYKGGGKTGMQRSMMYHMPEGVADAVLNLNDPERRPKYGFKREIKPLSGGKIHGSGSGKSDDIDMSAPEGSFIVPTENASRAMQYGKDYLGWEDAEVARRNYGNIDINVSNGEVFYTPDEYDALKYYGIDVDALAPDAEKNETGFCRGGKTGGKGRGKKEGGAVSNKISLLVDEGYPQKQAVAIALDMQRRKKLQDGGPVNFLEKDTTGFPLETDQLSFPYDSPGGTPWEGSLPQKALSNEFGEMTPAQRTDFIDEAVTSGLRPYNRPAPETPAVEEPSFWDKLGQNLGEIAGAAQIAGGAYGLYKGRKMPDVNVSASLQRLSAETRREAGYGLPPAVKNEMKKQAEQVFRNVSNQINAMGGSAQEKYNTLAAALSETLKAKYGIELSDYQEQQRKKDVARSVDMAKASQEFDIQKLSREDWYQMQEIWGNLLSAGINNVIGARQYKAQLDALKDIEKGQNITLKI